MSTPPFVELPTGTRVDRWQVRGSELAVMHAGLDADRPPDSWVVLVPGFTGSKEDFIAVLPRLAGTGIGALAYDQRGQFESDRGVDAGAYALGELAADLAGLVQEVAQRFALSSAPRIVGHSFGGLVVQEAVAAELLTPASIVLLCSGAGALPPERWGSLPDLVDALEHSDLATIWRIMRQLEQEEDIVPPPPDVLAFLERRWHANDPVQVREVARQLMSTAPATERVRVRVPLVPIVVMWGEHDDAWPVSDQARMAARLGVPGIALPGLGHSPNAQDAAALVAALLRAWQD